MRLDLPLERGRRVGALDRQILDYAGLFGIRNLREVEQDRKKGWKLLAALGLPGLLGLLRIRTIHQVADAVGRKLGLTVRTIEMGDPLAAVDVDKPADLDLVEAILDGRA